MTADAVRAIVADLLRQDRADAAANIEAAYADESWKRLKGLVSAGMGSLWDNELFPSDPVAEERFGDNLETVYEMAKARVDE
jgi:hypothetical protein